MNENSAITPTTTTRKPWRKPSPAQARASGQGLMNLINLVLMILAIRDIRRRSDEELNGKRKLWMLVAIVPTFGPIAYFIYLRRRRTLVTEIPLETPDTL
jgi:hypothetical protein